MNSIADVAYYATRLASDNRHTVDNLGSQSDTRITLSISAAFLNKKPLKGQASFIAFAQHPIALDGLVSHVLAGRAWMPSAAKNGSRNFQFAQALALDFDNPDGDIDVSAEALKHHPLISQFAAFVYETPSSTPARPKARALFILDGRIETAEGYRAAVETLIDLARDLKPDIQCKDSSRLFYGSKGAAHWVNPAAVLPLALLREHAIDMRNQDAVIAQRLKSTFDTAHKANQRYATQAQDDAQRITNPELYARTALENNSAAAAHAREGTRNCTLFIQAWKTYCVYEACGVPMLDIERAFYAAGRACGLPDNEIRVTLASAARYPRVVLRSMQGRAIGPDDTPPSGPTSPRKQYSAQAEYHSPTGETKELVYYDDPEGEGVPMLAALPDAVIKHGLDVWGKPVVIELNYLYSAQARGLLPSIFTLEDVNQARAADGIDTPAPVHVYTDMSKFGVLRKAKKELIDGLHPIDTTDACLSKKGCILSINSKRGRKPAAYALLSLDELKHAMIQPMASSFIEMHPETAPAIDEDLIPLIKTVLEGLLSWQKPYESLSLGLVRAFLSDAQEYRAEAVYEAIKALPITDAALLADMGLDAQQAAAVVSIASAQMDQTMTALSTLKNRVLMRLYQTHLDSLKNSHITPLPEGAPRCCEAWLDAWRNAVAMAHNGAHLWNYQLNSILGIKNKRSAKRAAKRAGISTTPREDTRVFTVPVQANSTPEMTMRIIKKAAKQAAKQGEAGRAQHVRSYDEKGRLIAAADMSESDPSLFKIGARFEVVVQMPNLITVSDAAPLADETPIETAAPAASETPAERIEKDAQQDETPRRRRITPARLHDRKWIIARLLAPFCQASSGVWFNPLTGELHESAEAVLRDAIALTALEAVS